MPDVFLHLPAHLTQRQIPRCSPHTITILFFIPGNPGLIDYYRPFLTLLANGRSSCHDRPVVIAGASLGGFEDKQKRERSSPSSSPRPSIRPADAYASDAKRDENSSATSCHSESDLAVKYGNEEDVQLLYPISFSPKDIYNLTDQIELTYARLNGLVTWLDGLLPLEAREAAVEVLVVGHSVGAHIGLEVLRKHYHESMKTTKMTTTTTDDVAPGERNRSDRTPKENDGDEHHSACETFDPVVDTNPNVNIDTARETTPSSSPTTRTPPTRPWTIKGTILLTPTIQDISLSPSGRIATPILTSTPWTPGPVLQLAASTLTAALPPPWLRALVRRATGIQSTAMLDVTLDFLRRPGAVRQALHLARFEMLQIGRGEWRDAVWGATATATAAAAGAGADAETKTAAADDDDDDDGWRAPTHHFLFARADHWVADETRDALVASFGGSATVVVDDGDLGLAHAWCLEQSAVVAGIVDEWITHLVTVHDARDGFVA